MDDNERWKHVETRLDRMETAIVAIARVDEKVSAYFTAADRMGRDIDKFKDKMEAENDQLRERVRSLEADYRTQAAKMSYWERIGWMIAAGVLASLQFIPK